jgi:hypothetical protein
MLPSPKSFPALAVFILVPAAWAQYTQQGAKLVGSYNTSLTPPQFGTSVTISADGNTTIVGGPGYTCGTQSHPQYTTNPGAAWIFTRSAGAWSQQGSRLAGSDAVGPGGDCWGGAVFQGSAVAISADGNTAIVGGFGDNNGIGAAWIYTRANGAWSQQGKKLVGSGYAVATGWWNAPYQGVSVAISGDGNTAIVGGIGDNDDEGSAWVFTRSGGVWTQQGGKLAGAAVYHTETQGSAVALSYDGNTAAIAGMDPRSLTPFVSVFVRVNGAWSQQGGRLSAGALPAIGGFGSGPAGPFRRNLAMSSDGNTIVLGSPYDNDFNGAAFVFTRSGGVWSQQGTRLAASGPTDGSQQGGSVAISGDGATIAVSSPYDASAGTGTGAVWTFRRSGTAWTQQGGRLVGTGTVTPAQQGYSVALSSDGVTLVEGGPWDNLTAATDPLWGDTSVGAAWVFSAASLTPAPVSVSALPVAGTSGAFAFTFSDPGGFQNLSVVNVLVRDVLDGRQACYLAFAPSGPNSGSLYLVDDAGDAGGPYAGMLLPGSGTVANSQCSVNGALSSVSGAGNNLYLTLSLNFASRFAGYKVVYLAARNATANSGWSALGTWNVTGAVPSGPWVSAMDPARYTGLSAGLQFTFTDPAGWQNISVANVLINSSLDGRHACYLALVPVSASSVSVLLVDDAGNAGGPYSGLVTGSGTVSNSQCSVAGAGFSVIAAGNNLTLTPPFTFKQAFAGNQIVYAAVRDKNGRNSGWQAVGTVTVR